ncbi:aminotransferase class III-fold pyridoxal phosphate-dependent enzyme [Vibrio sp. CAIM 722]|uniref:Aminotransferase class III-fold pyridoxal phosphate-dependent enzyme n=1 Tax=Vibrio eleionomae TaxID=2653505 RepID=A0A7X4LK33_9VIBR|nr:aminotransferase class III-fold pyridoxal phosphate-dependent enzyme [Vibrio eleionomae]MZI93072.1 aminotransferase class III-fold pyridoxal phosphate-dependent enzyme [Vibrio eleionomae]
MSNRKLVKHDELKDRAQMVIPGGMYGHLNSASLPSNYPQFFKKASGCRMWDVDDNEYIDYMCGYGANLLGYNHCEVEAAALGQKMMADTLTGPTELIVSLAEKLVSMISHADWAMFSKNGADGNNIAMMLARAYKGKKTILVARGAYHGSANWNTPVLVGITKEDRANIIYFEYNDPQSLHDAFAQANGDVAGIFATPFRHETFEDQFFPDVEYAKLARQLCDEHDAILIVDEVRTGFRVARDTLWSQMGVQPDISTWGKALSNGYPISALCANNKLRDAATKIFVTGTYWFSAVPMAAALATLNIIENTSYLEHIYAMATMLREGITKQAEQYDFELHQTGPVAMPQMLFANDPKAQLGFKWTSELIEQGVYFHPYHNMFISAAHKKSDIEATLYATEQAFIKLACYR